MPDQLEARISKDIANTGFPLELRVADTLRSRGYYVATNVFFIDRDESKAREVDIRALRNVFFTHRGMECAVRHCLIVECKKSTNKPWVFFMSRKNGYDQQLYQTPCHGAAASWIATPETLSTLERRHPWFRFEYRGRSFYEAFSGGQDTNPNIWKGLFAALKGMLDVHRDQFAAGYPFPNATFYYPLVVLQGDLFVARQTRRRLIVERASQVAVSVHFRSSQYEADDRHTVFGIPPIRWTV